MHWCWDSAHKPSRTGWRCMTTGIISTLIPMWWNSLNLFRCAWCSSKLAGTPFILSMLEYHKSMPFVSKIYPITSTMIDSRTLLPMPNDLGATLVQTLNEWMQSCKRLLLILIYPQKLNKNKQGKGARARARAKYENLAVAFLLNSDKKQYGDLISSKPSRTNTPTGQTHTPLCWVLPMTTSLTTNLISQTPAFTLMKGV